MKILFFTLCIVLQGLVAIAQPEQDPSPHLLTIDTTINTAVLFNNEVMQYAPGFRAIGADNSVKGKVLYSYTDGNGGFVRLEYRYKMENGRSLVIYQSVTADLAVIMPVVNGLFGTNMASDIQHASMISGPVSYDGKVYQCILQADDFKAGYWVLSFVK